MGGARINKEELEQAYGKAFIADGQPNYAIKRDINTGIPDLMAAFRKAAAGTDSITDPLLTAMVGRATAVYRSDRTDKNVYDFSAHALGPQILIDMKIANGGWSDAEKAGYDLMVDQLATQSGLHADHARTLLDEYESSASLLYGTHAVTFGASQANSSGDLKTEIGKLLLKRDYGGTMSADDVKKLDSGLAAFRGQNKLSQEEVDALVTGFRESSASVRISGWQSNGNRINTDINYVRSGTGQQLSVMSSEEHLVVPRVAAPTDAEKFASWLLTPGDAPKKLPPFSPEMGNFLVSLHEAEHARQEGQTVTSPGNTLAAIEQAKEIDADNAVLKFLDDAKEPGAKEYWMQSRQVRSFSDAIKYDNFSHDTATFLRVYEATGKQLDIDKFDSEKRALMAAIKGRLDMSDPAKIKTPEIMAATRDVLAEDDARPEGGRRLSPLQRAEAESFLHDAQAMGYEANRDYPRRPAASHAANQLPDELRERYEPNQPPARPQA